MSPPPPAAPSASRILDCVRTDNTLDPSRRWGGRQGRQPVRATARLNGLLPLIATILSEDRTVRSSIAVLATGMPCAWAIRGNYGKPSIINSCAPTDKGIQARLAGCSGGRLSPRTTEGFEAARFVMAQLSELTIWQADLAGDERKNCGCHVAGLAWPVRRFLSSEDCVESPADLWPLAYPPKEDSS